MNLIDFCNLNRPNTDKYDLGYIHEFYDHFFSKNKETVKNVLEIGIYYGRSIELWRNYFNNATIYGVDVNYCSGLEHYDRIIQKIGDAYSFNLVNTFEKESFDIVIDDGPHTFDSMVFFILHYLDLVKPGGLLVLEDIINPNWTPLLLYVLNLKSPNSKVHVYDMRNKQKTEYLTNLWKNGLDVIVVEK